jgi:hypothetical protein
MKRGTGGYLGLAAFGAGLMLASPFFAQAAEIGRQHNGLDAQYAYETYPYGYFCLTYPTYPMPTPPAVFSYDYGCPSGNIYRANLRTSRLVYPGALGAYDLYRYDLTDPLDHVAAPFVVLTWPIKALSTPAAEAEIGSAPLVTSRSVAIGQMGRLCSTPVKTCELEHGSYVGNGCSCRVPGGRARGSVVP